MASDERGGVKRQFDGDGGLAGIDPGFSIPWLPAFHPFKLQSKDKYLFVATILLLYFYLPINAILYCDWAR
jgi:hypothetical protein